MNVLTIIVGVCLIVFGLVTTVLRFRKPSALGKLEAMKERWGDRTGALIHVVAYSVLPIAAGAIFVAAGALGVALF